LARKDTQGSEESNLASGNGEVPPPPNAPLPDIPVGPTTVRALNLAKNFPFEVLSAALWENKYIFGSDSGLYQLDASGTLSKLIAKTRFQTISVLDDYGVLIGICGRHSHIRMYNLDDLILDKHGIKKMKQRNKEPFSKIRETKGCSHYSIVRTKGTVFMIAAIKRRVILFMWADYPFNKFMKIKDFYVPEIATRVEPILAPDGKIAQLCIQCVSRFILINVDTNLPTEISMPLSKKLAPLLIHRSNDSRIFVAYNKGGHFLDGKTYEPTGKFFLWRFIPVAVVPLGRTKVLAFGSKMIDVFSLETGEEDQSIRHKESKKINYLLTQNEDVIIAARGVKGPKISNVYIMRAVPLNQQEQPNLES